MESVKLTFEPRGYYAYSDASNSEMFVLGMLLSEIGCSKNGRPSLQDWALADKNDPHCGFNHCIGTNVLFLDEDDNGDLHIVDDTGSDPDDEYYIPSRIKMSRKQFVTLLDEWEEEVCAYKPRNVLVKYDGSQYFVEPIFTGIAVPSTKWCICKIPSHTHYYYILSITIVLIAIKVFISSCTILITLDHAWCAMRNILHSERHKAYSDRLFASERRRGADKVLRHRHF